MKKPIRVVLFHQFLCAAILFAASSTICTAAVTDDVVVSGKSGPWSWTNGGLNTNFQYGRGDQFTPTVLTQSNSGFSFTPGTVLTISYLSGTTAPGSGYPGIIGGLARRRRSRR
jgi:hypothetical protein